MYRDVRRNLLIIGVSLIVGIGTFVAIRQQTAVGDRQFVRSMIPHHSGAILMCREVTLDDPQLRQLCQTIIASQQQEIDQMNRILERLP